MVLQSWELQVTAAPSLEVARAAASSQTFDLLISDIELPDGTGLELMREIRPTQTLAGIAMSGFGSEDDIQLSLNAGFREHLTKPVDIARLDAAIGRALGEDHAIATIASDR
jgi:DNA-binding response OmpR family regulator